MTQIFGFRDLVPSHAADSLLNLRGDERMRLEHIPGVLLKNGDSVKHVFFGIVQHDGSVMPGNTDKEQGGQQQRGRQ